MINDLEYSNLDLNNPYKMLWLIITNQADDIKLIRYYNQISRYYNINSLTDTQDYTTFRKNHSIFMDLMKQRGELNISINN